MVIYGCKRGVVESWALEQQLALVLFGEQSKHIPSNSCAAERCLRRQGFPAMWEMQLHCFWPKLLLKDFRGSHVKSDCDSAVLPSPPLCSWVSFPSGNVTVFAQTLSQDADPATAQPNLCSCAGCFSLRVQSCVLSLGMCSFHLPSPLNLHSCRFLFLHSREMSRTAISRK